MRKQTIVVSGGGTGIGRATAVRLVGDGWHVTVVGRRRPPLEALGEQLDGVDVVVADVATEEGVGTVVARLTAAGRSCAGVVAAAGGASPAPASGTRLAQLRADWLIAFESNVLTAALLVEALRPQLVEQAGRVVLLSSVAAMRGSGGGPYGAMKAALHAWMFDLARQLGEHGGTANVVAPGFVPDTEFWTGRLTEQARADRAAQTLVGRAGSPAEVASLIAWLLGPDGGWMTGQILSPNGGVVLGR
jgi:3-oxoacyl-[acyl-carrier protein] reductase